MKAVNLYILTRNTNEETYTEYENVLSGRPEVQKVREHEFKSLIRLVQILRTKRVAIRELEGFYYSYVIKQIGKEFDLLKINKDDRVLNIELKSDSVSEEKMERQLKKNKYYLSHLAPTIQLFTFVEETESLYTLTEDGLKECEFKELLLALRDFEEFETGDIDRLFCPKDFLISPFNNPDKFIENRYFLTQQQEGIKKEIMEAAEAEDKMQLWGITGKAGTGKTLLLYDIAKTCSASGKCCIIHSGILCAGHLVLDEHYENIDIISAKDANSWDFGEYRFLFVDEAQRIYRLGLQKILAAAKQYQSFVLFSYDYFQTMSRAEQHRNIPEKLQQIEGFQERKLSDKIRSNEEMSSFIRNLMDLKDVARKKYHYEAIDILYAGSQDEAKRIIRYYRQEKDYVFIEYTKSRYVSNPIDGYHGDMNTHHVIGQEFDNVVLIMDKNFRYNEEGRLQGKRHPNPDYIFYKLFFQGVSRAREKLCLVVVDNPELFGKIVNIKYRSIEVKEEE